MPVETLFKQKVNYKDNIKISFKGANLGSETARVLNIINMLKEDKVLKFENKTHIERLICKNNIARRIFFDEITRL